MKENIIIYIYNIAQYFGARGKNGDEVPCAYFFILEQKKYVGRIKYTKKKPLRE